MCARVKGPRSGKGTHLRQSESFGPEKLDGIDEVVELLRLHQVSAVDDAGDRFARQDLDQRRKRRSVRQRFRHFRHLNYGKIRLEFRNHFRFTIEIKLRAKEANFDVGLNFALRDSRGSFKLYLFEFC